MFRLRLLVFFIVMQIPGLGFSQDFWIPLPYPDSTWGYAMNVENSSYIFFGNRESPSGLYKSNPEFIDWEYCSSVELKIFDMAIDANENLFMVCDGYIYKTADYGNTFDTLHYASMDFISIEIDQNDGIWVGFWGGILHSDDGGNNWDTVMLTISTEVFYDFAFGLNGEVYAVSTHFSAPTGGFYRSLDNGITWENTGLANKSAHSIAVNSNGDIFVGCYFTGVVRSTDIGLTWTNVKNDIDAVSVIIDYENKIFCANIGQNWVHNLGVHFSDDNGQTWDTINQNGLSNKYIRNVYLNEQNYLYVLSREGYGHQLFRSNNPVVGMTKMESEQTEVSLFPNPCIDILNLQSHTHLNEKYNYKIFSITGTILQTGIIINTEQTPIDVSLFPPGMYIIQLHSIRNSNCKSILFQKR